jgi:hypothetical protein
MSLTSAECTEIEYATKRYSESPPPVGTKTDKGDTAPRKRGREFAQNIQVELDFSSDEAPTSPRSIYLREIHLQIDHNEMLQRRLAHSTKLLHNAERIAMGEGNALAPQAVCLLAPALPPAPIPPLGWRQITSSKCLGPNHQKGLSQKDYFCFQEDRCQRLVDYILNFLSLCQQHCAREREHAG